MKFDKYTKLQYKHNMNKSKCSRGAQHLGNGSAESLCEIRIKGQKCWVIIFIPIIGGIGYGNNHC